MPVTMETKVDTSGLDDLRRRIRELQAKDAKVRIGVFSSAGEVEGGGISLATLATIHEFGSENVEPPIQQRSFLRATFRARREQARAFCARVCGAFVEGRIDLAQALGLLGEWGVSQVRGFIRSNSVKPPDKESTIAAKGSSVTLVDTSQLIKAITWVASTGDSGSGEGEDEP